MSETHRLPNVAAMQAKRKMRRDALAPSVLQMYAQDKGHRTIAKALGISPRIARTILIEQGVYQPGKLHGGPNHRAALKAAQLAKIPAWKHEQRRRKENAKKSERTTRVSDLGLFQAARQRRERERSPVSARAYRHRYATDIPFRITEILRRRLRKVAKRGRGYSGNHLEWLGCIPVELQAHLEAQFKEGMTWANVGTGEGKWHIDHIRPCASFNMLVESERLECFHYSNLRPMWSLDNMAKGSLWNGVRHGVNKGSALMPESVNLIPATLILESSHI